MFDLARLIIWAVVFWRCVRQGGWLGRTALLVLVASLYIFVLEVVSGITVRDDGPMSPVGSMILVFIGPSAMPRGALPHWLPLGALYLAHTYAPGLLLVVALWLLARAFDRRATELPMARHAAAVQLDRVHLLLTLYAIVCVFQIGARALPRILGGDFGSGRIESAE
jgi:hypothetical protein